MSHIRQEYPVYGTSDYRQPAIEICQTNGSKISDFHYQSHSISKGKPKLENLPATYTENDDEALTLTIHLQDPVTLVEIDLLYTILLKMALSLAVLKSTIKVKMMFI